MNDHPDESELSAFVDAEVPLEEGARLEAHLSLCPSCRTQEASLREVKGALAGLPRRRLPEGLGAALEALGREAGERLLDEEPLRPRMGSWAPAGALVAASLLLAVWTGNRWGPTSEGDLPLEPLLAAHSRYAAESLVPGDLVAADFSAELVEDDAAIED